MKKVLITYPIPKEGLTELFGNYEVSYPDHAGMDRAEILDVIADYDALIPPGAKIDRVILDAATKLQVISNYGAGYDNIDVAYCTAKGILVTNIPEAVTESAAELAFGLMISVMRRIAECDRHLRSDGDFDWGIMQNLGHNLFGKTLGIIGMGRIGRALARRAQAFGMKIIYTDERPLATAQAVDELGAVYQDFDTLLKNADVLSLHVPYSAQTHHLIGEKELAALQPTAVIINTSRGPVIDEAALAKYLKNGMIAGAGLDVFEQEPLITPELKKLDRVVLTPHIGTATVENRVLMARAVAKNIMDFFSYGTAPFMVNPEVISKK
jgi:D-3-phosphoglycerate dehydrogenase